MTVPDFMQPDVPPAPERGEPFRPFILSQEPGPSGTVLVTWSLPGLRRLTLRVPESSWIDGDHFAAGALATFALDAMLPDFPRDIDNGGHADDGVTDQP